MSFRIMRIIVMFDLPCITSAERREYNVFRKYLIKSGFYMLQESIYCKLALNATMANSILTNIRKNKPKYGLVQVLKITEKQYNSMEVIVGQNNLETLESYDRVVIL